MNILRSGNSNLRDYPGFDGTVLTRAWPTKANGSYRIVGLPGPGLIVVWCQHGRDYYLKAVERDDEFGIREPSPGTAPYGLFPLANYGAVARINPAIGLETIERDVTLDPGWTIKGTVLGLDHTPLAGVHGFGIGEHEPLKTAEFTVQAFNPSQPRDDFLSLSRKGFGWHCGSSQGKRGPRFG